MKIVPAASRRPHILVGHRSMNDNMVGNGVIDTGQESDGFHLYVSNGAGHAIARVLGYVEPGEYKRTVDALEELLSSVQAELAGLKENLSVPLAEVIDFFEARARLEAKRDVAQEPVA